MLEMQAICRSHVASRGGNALVSYKITRCLIADTATRGQGQALLMITGDVVELRSQEKMQK
jgi:hypothetical protein